MSYARARAIARALAYAPADDNAVGGRKASAFGGKLRLFQQCRTSSVRYARGGQSTDSAAGAASGCNLVHSAPERTEDDGRGHGAATRRRDAFGRVARICEVLRNAGQVITLRMPPTLATRWFLPRLPSLREAMPDMDVRLTTYDAWVPKFEDNDIDAAILQGRGEWQNFEAVKIMPELLTPVCCPELGSGLTDPGDLAKAPLLHCDPLTGWPRWLDRAGVGQIPSHRGQTFDTLELALSAIRNGWLIG